MNVNENGGDMQLCAAFSFVLRKLYVVGFRYRGISTTKGERSASKSFDICRNLTFRNLEYKFVKLISFLFDGYASALWRANWRGAWLTRMPRFVTRFSAAVPKE